MKNLKDLKLGGSSIIAPGWRKRADREHQGPEAAPQGLWRRKRERFARQGETPSDTYRVIIQRRTGTHGKMKTHFVLQVDASCGCDHQGLLFCNHTDDAETPF